MEHYEIATYGCLCTWAELLGNSTAVKLLEETMSEEEGADQHLSELAEQYINQEATEGMEADQPRSQLARPNGRGKQRQFAS